jgi:predicted MPP superfamily phosphohydrolase
VSNSAVSISIRGRSVWVGGLAVGAKGALRGLLASAPPDQLRILLHHYPDAVLRAAKIGVDLYLAGHTHGGQVALPFYGALVTLSTLGKAFESGLHRVGNTWEYTNRGLGMEGGTAPRVRFAARPEVTVIDVR